MLTLVLDKNIIFSERFDSLIQIWFIDIWEEIWL